MKIFYRCINYLITSPNHIFTAQQTEQILSALNRSNCRNTLKYLSLRHSNFDTMEATNQLLNFLAFAKCLEHCWIDMQRG